MWKRILSKDDGTYHKTDFNLLCIYYYELLFQWAAMKIYLALQNFKGKHKILDDTLKL